MVNPINEIDGVLGMFGIVELLSIGLYIVIVVNLISYMKPQFQDSKLKQMVLIILCIIWPLLLVVVIISYMIKLFTDKHK